MSGMVPPLLAAANASEGELVLIAGLLAVALTMGLIVLWIKLHPESPGQKRRHRKEAQRDAIEHWDEVQQARMAGRWWER